MNNYELTVVVNGKLDEDGKNAVLGKVKELVERFGGEIRNVNDQGRKRFAYEIQKQRDGYYTFIKFTADKKAPAEIESRMRIMDNVMRYLLVVDEYPDAVAEVRSAENTSERVSREAEEDSAVEESAASEEAGDEAEASEDAADGDEGETAAE